MSQGGVLIHFSVRHARDAGRAGQGALTGVAEEARLLEVDARAGAEGRPVHLVLARHVQLQQPARAL